MLVRAFLTITGLNFRGHFGVKPTTFFRELSWRLFPTGA